MKRYPMLYTDNLFSWRRLAMLARLYQPVIGRGLLICALAPALVALLASALYVLTGDFPRRLYTMPVALLLYLSPIMLTRRDCSFVSAQLPVTATEKFAFLILLFWIVVPLVVFASTVVGGWASAALFGEAVSSYVELQNQQMLSTLPYGLFKDKSLLGIELLSYLSFIPVVTIVLYYVVTSTKNRVLAAFASLFVSYLAVVVLGFLAGGVMGFVAGYNSGAQGLSAEEEQAALSQLMMSGVSVWVGCILAGMLMAEVVFLVKLYKRLRNCGF